MSQPDVLVIGCGIVGLACARELALAGMKVELLERLAAGNEASLAAAGLLSPMAEATPGPFLDACRASRDLWMSWVPTLADETGITIEHDAHGALLLALDDDDLDWMASVEAAALDCGEIVRHIDGDLLSRWVPDISPNVRRCILLPGEHRVDNVQACAVLSIAAQRAGVTIHHGVEVEEVERKGDAVRIKGRHRHWETGLLVLAAGAWSGRIPGLPELPVRPRRGQMLLLGGVEWSWNGSLRWHHGYAVRRGATGLLSGATVEDVGFAKHTTSAGVHSLLGSVLRFLPGLQSTPLETTWSGLRPCAPDDLPILGRIPGWPVLAATAHFRNGILLAPWTAQEIVRMAIAGGDDGAGPFSPARFLPNGTAGGLSPRPASV